MPTSVGFFLKAYDPRKHDYAYATFKRLPDGCGIVFGGFGAVTAGNNAVTACNPVTDTWETLLATQTFTIGHHSAVGASGVYGQSVLADWDLARDRMVVTNGINVNIYDSAPIHGPTCR